MKITHRIMSIALAFIMCTGLICTVNADDNTANFWYAGGKYAFDKNVAFVGEYAQNTEANTEDQAWTAELQYKGANPADAGSNAIR